MPKVARRADTADGIIDLAGTRLDVVDELAQRTYREIRMHRENHRIFGDHADGRKILDRVVGDFLHLRYDRQR